MTKKADGKPYKRPFIVEEHDVTSHYKYPEGKSCFQQF